MGDFQFLIAAAVEGPQIDVLACDVLADWLQDRGDDRGERLRKRVKKYDAARDYHVDISAKWVAWGWYSFTEQQRVLAKVDNKFLSYFYRLMAAKHKEPVQPERVGLTFVCCEPIG